MQPGMIRSPRRSNGSLPLRGALLLLLLAGIAGACRHVPVRSAPPVAPLLWPPPPDVPRIEYLGEVRIPADAGIRSNWFVRFVGRVFLGPRRDGMARPYAVAVGFEGAILVADPDARCVHLFDVTRGKYRRLDRAGDEPLVSPVGIATDAAGRIYVADSVRRAVFRFDPSGRWLDTIGGGDRLIRPTGLAFDSERDRLYVVDTLAHRILVLDASGRTVGEIGRRGQADGEFNFPVAVALDRTGRIFVSDSMNFRVQVLEADGRFVRAFGEAGSGAGGFDKAKGIALDADGNIYVVEGLHDVVQVFDGEGRLSTVLGSSGSGPGEFDLPAGIHVDGNGRILVADSANHRIVLFHYLGDPGRVGEGS